jgi:hypothetical protein
MDNLHQLEGSPLRCEWMVLCEEFDLSRVSGNPSILGMISALVADTLPVRIDPLLAAFRLVGDPDEHATIALIVQNEAGGDVKGHPLSLRLPKHGVCETHISLAPIEIQAFGKYSVVLRLDGLDAFRTTFWVTAPDSFLS